MRRGTNLLLAILMAGVQLLCARTITITDSGRNGFTIEPNSANSIIVTVEIGSINSDSVQTKGGYFQALSVNGFSSIRKVGAPELPAIDLSMAIAKGAILTCTVLEAEEELITGISVSPFIGEVKITDRGDEFPDFIIDETIYGKSQLFPAALTTAPDLHVHRGVSIAEFSLCPVRVTPLTRELRIYKKLKVLISFEGGVRSRSEEEISKEHLRRIKNSISNGEHYFNQERTTNSIIDDGADDILIVTTPAFAEAADSLALWQRMKGYDVKVLAQSWSSMASVKSAVHSFYEQTTPKPSFLVIIGDKEQVPTEIFKEQVSNDEYMASDLAYVTMDGLSDTDPEMAKGRISVTTANEALEAVSKIIEYERNPTTKSDFYNSMLACTYFQGSSTSQMNFTASIEASTQFLEAKNIYDIERIYYTSASNNPTKYGTMQPNAGEPIPSFLRKPAFAWDGDKYDIINGINSGSFFVYHYDHGLSDGWGDPRFRTSDMASLANKGMYPIVNSINCYSGSFQDPLCFAEKLVRMKEAGACGVFAATIWTLTGSNNKVQQAFVNSIWPGLTSDGEPLYQMGDVIQQCYSAIAKYYQGNPGHKRTFIGGYHYFGDPTTKIWTAEPEEISVSHDEYINLTADYTLSSLNIREGVATIVNPQTGQIVGKSTISGSTVTLTPDSELAEDNDSLLLTITAHNYRPYMKKILASTTGVIGQKQQSSMVTLSVDGLTVPLMKGAQNLTIDIYAINGRKISTIGLAEVQKSKSISLPNISAGVYFLEVRAGTKTLFRSKFNKL